MVAVPKELLDIKTYLLDNNVRTERWGRYKIEHWKKYFGHDEDFCEYTAKNPGPLCRQDFADIGELPLERSTRQKQLFYAAMLWGYGTIGYGAYRTSIMLKTPDTMNHIASAYDFIAKGKVADAYRALQLNNCGPAYISKFLYAAGLCTKSKPLPVILDSIVAKSLKTLLDNIGEDHTKYFKLSKGSSEMVLYNPEGYERYVLMINDWADQLGVFPDEVEFFLFDSRF